MFDKVAEDYDFWLNFIDDGQKAVLLDDVLFFNRLKPIAESRSKIYGERMVKKEHKLLRKQLRANMRRKHPKVAIYKTLFNITRHFFCWRATERGMTLHILRIPVYRKANGGLIAGQKTTEGKMP
jgi:hypothetical protein